MLPRTMCCVLTLSSAVLFGTYNEAHAQQGPVRQAPGTAASWGEDPGERELRLKTNGLSISELVRLARPRPRRRKPRKLPEVDQRIITGATFTCIGLVGLAIGGTAYNDGINDGFELCGITGCVTRPNHVSRLAGESMMLGAAVMTAASLPVLLTGLLADDRQILHNEGQMRAGTSLTLIGVGMFTAGVSAILLEQPNRQGRLGTFGTGSSFNFSSERTDADVLGGLTIGAGAIMTILGVPLWLNGGRRYQLPVTRLPRTALTSAIPEVTMGPGGGLLSWKWH